MNLKCKICGFVIKSQHRHDFKQCGCKSCFIDGGTDYCRVGGEPLDMEWTEETEDEQIQF